MTRQIVEQTATTVSATVPYWTFAGTWTAAVADTNASGGSYASSSSVGATATLTVPAGASPVVDGVLLLCSRVARTGNASVRVDGVLQTDAWVQDTFTTAAATAGQTWAVTSVPATNQPVAWQRTAYRPIKLTTGIAHTILITVVTGPVTVDAAECYTSEAMVVGRVTSLGTSITSGSDLSSALTQRFSALAAAAVGGTDDNHSFAGSALIYHTGTSNTVVDAVGWEQAEGLIGSVNGNMTGCLVTTAGTGYNAIPTVAYSAPQSTRGVAATGSCTLSGTTVQFMTITQGGHGYTSGPTVAFTPTSGGTGAAAGPGTFTGLDVYSNGAHSWGRDPEWLLLHHGVNDYNTFAGSDPGGGVGYVRELYKQRIREAIWRTNLNSPTTTVLVLGIGYVNDGGVNNSGRQLYSAALGGVAAEPTMVNTRYVDTYANFINRGGNALFVTSGGTTIHPNAAGHAVIAEAVVAAMFAARARPGGRWTAG